MTTIQLCNALWLCAGALCFAATNLAQKPAVKPQPTPKALIFAVLDSGKRIEPIDVSLAVSVVCRIICKNSFEP